MTSIPLQLVTGFLGSGKTTFLKNYLKEFSGSRKIGIIQNEFSEINVDGIELKQENADFSILEVNNGSVFCVCLLGSFVGSLAAFIDEIQPDELIMEASGMSDPLSIGQILQSQILRQKVYLDRVWCLVDAVNFLKISRLHTRINHQIRIADLVILNKTDLVDLQRNDIGQLIYKLNPFATIEFTSFAKIEFDKYRSKLKFLPSGDQAENVRPDLESQVVKSNRIITPEKLDQFIEIIKPDCIRCKGFINIARDKKIFLQGIYEEISLQEVNFFAAPTEFVLIGNYDKEQYFLKIFESLCTS